MLDPHRGACHADDWMQDAKAATVGFKACRCIRYGFESERTTNTLCLNADINGEFGRIRAFATCLIGDDETAVALLDVQIMDLRIIGPPVAIPHQIGDGTQNFDTVVSDGAKIAVVQIQAKQARFQMRRLSFGFTRSIEQEKIDAAHLSSAVMSTRLPLAALS